QAGTRAHEQRPAHGVDVDRADCLAAAVRELEGNVAPGRDLATGPFVAVEPARAKSRHPRLEAREERLEERGAIDRPVAGKLTEARHPGGELHRERDGTPVDVDA